MKKSILLLFLLSCAVFANASGNRSRPDFSGNWTLDRSQSDLGPFAQGNFANASMTMSIAYREPEFKLVRHVEANGQEVVQNYTYYTDGRGETNPGLLGSAPVKSVTKWEGAKLVSRSSTSISTRAGGNLNIGTIERRELSPDGNTLTITMVINAQQHAQNVKLVFTRAS